MAPGLVYAGTQTFELYGVATAEQHVFVELDGTRIKRLLWVQFEGYHASNTNTYNYRDETVAHSGRTWHRRINAVQVPATEARPDSDGARMRAFLRAKGWRIGPELMTERLVWLHASSDADWNIIPSPMMKDWPRVLLTTVTFEENGGQTKMRLTWVPHEASEAEIACFAAAIGGADKGWAAGMVLLAELLAELQA